MTDRFDEKAKEIVFDTQNEFGLREEKRLRLTRTIRAALRAVDQAARDDIANLCDEWGEHETAFAIRARGEKAEAGEK